MVQKQDLQSNETVHRAAASISDSPLGFQCSGAKRSCGNTLCAWEAIFVLFFYKGFNIQIYITDKSAKPFPKRSYKCAPSENLCPHACLNPKERVRERQ